MFNAEVEPTGKKRYLKEDLQIYHRLSYNEPTPQNMAVRIENEIAVKMGESDYKRFMDSYSNYLRVVYAMENDPVVKDMFYKMMVYMRLKH